MPNGVIGTANGKIIFANPCVCEILGSNFLHTQRSLDENNNICQLNASIDVNEQLQLAYEYEKRKSEEDKKTIEPITLSKYISEEYKKRGHEIIRFQFNSGTTRKVIDVSWTQIEDGEEDMVCFCLKDWTKMEELEEENIKMTRKLDRLLMSSVTHELRNPLHGVLGMFEQIESKVSDPQIRHFCYLGLNFGKLMLNLVNDILDFSQIEANKLKLQFTKFNPIEILHECHELFELQAKRKNLFLVEKYNKDVIPNSFCSDKNRYRQILINLISNALKFTFSGGIEVSLDFEHIEGILITQVKDTGIGMDPEETVQLFKLFGKLESSSSINPQGVGLGLDICKKLSNHLGGDIKVESKKKEGTIFRFHIKDQIVLEEPRPIEKSKSNKNLLNKRKESYQECSPENNKEEIKKNNWIYHKIMVVDDSEMNVMLLQHMLERIGLKCETVH